VRDSCLPKPTQATNRVVILVGPNAAGKETCTYQSAAAFAAGSSARYASQIHMVLGAYAASHAIDMRVKQLRQCVAL